MDKIVREVKYPTSEQKDNLRCVYNQIACNRQRIKDALESSEEDVTVLYLLSTGARIHADLEEELRMLMTTCLNVAKGSNDGELASEFFNQYKKFLSGEYITNSEETTIINTKGVAYDR